MLAIPNSIVTLHEALNILTDSEIHCPNKTYMRQGYIPNSLHWQNTQHIYSTSSLAT